MRLCRTMAPMKAAPFQAAALSAQAMQLSKNCAPRRPELLRNLRRRKPLSFQPAQPLIPLRRPKAPRYPPHLSHALPSSERSSCPSDPPLPEWTSTLTLGQPQKSQTRAGKYVRACPHAQRVGIPPYPEAERWVLGWLGAHPASRFHHGRHSRSLRLHSIRMRRSTSERQASRSEWTSDNS
jgi:hypothetical protein